MKNKAILVSFIAIFALVFALSMVAATEHFVNIEQIDVNGVEVIAPGASAPIAVSVSETIPVVVRFSANDLANLPESVNFSDVEVKVSLLGTGFREEVSDMSGEFHMIEGNTYVKRFSLHLPSRLDPEDLSRKVFLEVEFTAKDQRPVRDSYTIELLVQREQNSLNLLSIDMEDVVTVGSRVAVDVVVENAGHERLDNVYVKASIPGLGISRTVYVGDLASGQDTSDDAINDAVSKRVYLTIPRNAVPGNYEVEVEAYNYDASEKAVSRVVVRSVDTGLYSSTASKTVAPGQETSFDLVLVNPTDQMVVYTITPEESGLIVEVSESVVAVSADSSRTVKVKVKATSSAEEGTYLVAINANSESGLSKQVSYSVNVQKGSGITGSAVSVTNTTVVLTIILVIVFVVLLIILIVLLSKKPAEAEELGETNYY